MPLETTKDTLLNGSNSSEGHDIYSVIFANSESFKRLMTPILVTTGVFTNLIAILAFARSELRHLSVGVYTISLSLADSLVLAIPVGITWISEELSTAGYMTLVNRAGWCETHAYFDMIFCSISAWNVVAIGIERWFAVCKPWYKARYCTFKRALFAEALIVILSWITFSWFPIIMHVSSEGVCTFRQGYGVLYKVLGAVGVVLIYVVPFVLTAVLNGLIISSLRQRVIRRRTTLLASTQFQGDSPDEQAISIMLVTVSVAFLVLTFPFQVNWLYTQVAEELDPQNERWHPLTSFLFNVTFTIRNMNYTINFFLYTAMSKMFRRELKKLFCCDGACRKKLRSPLQVERKGKQLFCFCCPIGDRSQRFSEISGPSSGPRGGHDETMIELMAEAAPVTSLEARSATSKM